MRTGDGRRCLNKIVVMCSQMWALGSWQAPVLAAIAAAALYQGLMRKLSQAASTRSPFSMSRNDTGLSASCYGICEIALSLWPKLEICAWLAVVALAHRLQRHRRSNHLIQFAAGMLHVAITRPITRKPARLKQIAIARGADSVLRTFPSIASKATRCTQRRKGI